MLKNKRILFSIMGWGLGHATRCIPIIKSLIKDNHVILASNGISTMLLQQEFPTLKYIDYPDYAVKYPRNRIMLLPLMTLQLPGIIIKMIKEYLQTQRVVTDENIDIIDLILDIDKIFNFSPALWSFEECWIGGESYILVSSSTLWQQNVKTDLIANSPLNVHYIFLSNLDSNYDDMLNLTQKVNLIGQKRNFNEIETNDTGEAGQINEITENKNEKLQADRQGFN